MFAVMGATGNTGGRIAELLLESGAKVRALGRSRAKLGELQRQGAEPMEADAANAAELARAFQGAEAVYTLIPSHPQAEDIQADQDRMGEAIAHALAEARVRHVVFLSSLGAELESGTGPITGLYRHEQRLRLLRGIEVLSLRAGYFFENNYSTLGLIKHQGINASALAPDVEFPMIATRDIADFAARAMRTRNFRGFTTHELLGARDLSMREVTRILGERLGHPELPYVQMNEADFQNALTQMGFSASVARAYAEMSRAINERRVRSIEGRGPANTTPTRFEEFVEQLVPAFETV